MKNSIVKLSKPGLSALGRQDPGLAGFRRTTEESSIEGKVVLTRLRGQKLTVHLQQKDGSEAAVYFKGSRMTVELFVLLEYGDLIAVIGQARLTGGILGKTVHWFDLTEEELAKRRYESGARLASLLAENGGE